MSTSPNPLSTVLNQAEDARDEALAEFQQARQGLDSARAQLQSLRDFRRQYQDRWQAQFSRSGGVEIMRCYTDFMTRMDEAEAEQQRRVEHAGITLERCRLHLGERERKVAAVSQLIERRDQERQRVETRRDQKATDELAARLGARTGLGASPLTSTPHAPVIGHPM